MVSIKKLTLYVPYVPYSTYYKPMGDLPAYISIPKIQELGAEEGVGL